MKKNNTTTAPEGKQDFKIGDKVKDLSNIQGTVLDVNPGLIRVAFGEDGKSNWRDLSPKYLTLIPLQDKGNGQEPGAIEYIENAIKETKVYLRNRSDVGQLDMNTDPTQSLSFTRGKQAGLCIAYEKIIKQIPQLKAENEKLKEVIRKMIGEFTCYTLQKETIPIVEEAEKLTS